ncbi:hypothetical protein PIB30_064116 [Stylosanthes scabra]|uniref:Uncharacterized protein n=1 Tax=Stylosanthes scabra TaxID=79078 RepID=A0ABU6TM72_9FABA|nr:hypothetical protein [Stylosanthes scabra]
MSLTSLLNVTVAMWQGWLGKLQLNNKLVVSRRERERKGHRNSLTELRRPPPPPYIAVESTPIVTTNTLQPEHLSISAFHQHRSPLLRSTELKSSADTRPRSRIISSSRPTDPPPITYPRRFTPSSSHTIFRRHTCTPQSPNLLLSHKLDHRPAIKLVPTASANHLRHPPN